MALAKYAEEIRETIEERLTMRERDAETRRRQRSADSSRGSAAERAVGKYKNGNQRL